MQPVIQSLIVAAAPAQPPSMLPSLGLMALIFGIFYFLVIAPARKKQKKHAEMLNNLKAGDNVITNGGIHCTIVGVGEDLFQVRIAHQVKIDVSKNAVAAMQNPEE